MSKDNEEIDISTSLDDDEDVSFNSAMREENDKQHFQSDNDFTEEMGSVEEYMTEYNGDGFSTMGEDDEIGIDLSSESEISDDDEEDLNF